MTFFESSGQAAIFLMLLYAGAAAGVIYDLLAPLRRRLPSALAGLPDLIWCLLAAALCAFALMLGGEGKARPYALLGLCCGGGIYCLGARQLARGAAHLCKSRICPFLRRISPSGKKRWGNAHETQD